MMIVRNVFAFATSVIMANFFAADNFRTIYLTFLLHRTGGFKPEVDTNFSAYLLLRVNF